MTGWFYLLAEKLGHHKHLLVRAREEEAHTNNNMKVTPDDHHNCPHSNNKPHPHNHGSDTTPESLCLARKDKLTQINHRWTSESHNKLQYPDINDNLTQYNQHSEEMIHTDGFILSGE